jgi:hypothetical protein
MLLFYSGADSQREAEVHLHFPWRVRRDMRSGQFRDALERIEYDPDTDGIAVLWRKTEA